MYADDTAVLLSGKSLNDLLDIQNTELDLLCNWLQSNKLSINTHVDFFPSRSYGIIFKARAVEGKKSLMNLYYSYINPYLIYCIEVWGTALKTHLDLLFLVQKKNL